MDRGLFEQMLVVIILLMTVMFLSFDLAIDEGKSVRASCRQALIWGAAFMIYVGWSYAYF